MTLGQNKLELNTYFIDMTYTLPLLTKVFYVRAEEVADDVLFRKFSVLQRNEEIPDAILFAKIPYLQFMRQVYVYSDRNREHRYFSVLQTRFAFPHRYVIRDEQDSVIGFIETKSLLFNRTWKIINELGAEIGSLKENVGENIAEEFRLSIQKSFSFGFFIQDKMVGDIEIETDYYSLSRKFILNLNNDRERKLDRRLALAFIFIVDDFVGTVRRGTPGV